MLWELTCCQAKAECCLILRKQHVEVRVHRLYFLLPDSLRRRSTILISMANCFPSCYRRCHSKHSNRSKNPFNCSFNFIQLFLIPLLFCINNRAKLAAEIIKASVSASASSKSRSPVESMQNWGRQLSNLFEFFIIRRPKVRMPVSKCLFQFAVEYLCPHLQE